MQDWWDRDHGPNMDNSLEIFFCKRKQRNEVVILRNYISILMRTIPVGKEKAMIPKGEGRIAGRASVKR